MTLAVQLPAIRLYIGLFHTVVVCKGGLPVTWAPLIQAKLQMLSLRSNLLSGSVPTSWGSLSEGQVLALSQFDLSNNTCICGDRPAWLNTNSNGGMLTKVDISATLLGMFLQTSVDSAKLMPVDIALE